ncbi:MAG: HD domain-containing protein [Asgard group archaeon]|nr:HD domain-containing protein [Asgard group archaeon]
MISTTRNLLSIKRLLNIHRLQPRTVAFIHTGQIMNSIKDLSENKWQPQDALPPHIKELLTTGSAPSNYMLAFLQIIRSLKFQKRTGWLDHEIPEEATESIADHMYRMGVISMLVPKGVDSDKCVKIAIVHDIAEALVGDITPYAGITKQEKHRRELATINYLSEVIKPYNEEFSKELLDLWLDYEEIRNIEARYVKDIDKFEMIQTAWEYEQQFGLKHNLDQFYTSRSAIKTKEIGDLCDALLEKRNKLVEDSKAK